MELQTEDYLPGAVRSIDVGCGRVIFEFFSQSRESKQPAAINCASHSPWQVFFRCS
jgi:hypothetical protein